MSSNVTLRFIPLPTDPELVREIVSSTGFFLPHEIPVAVELVDERIEKGEESGYFFVFADFNGKPVSYACYGPIPCTIGSYDLYWIATHNDFRGKGIGKLVLNAVEVEVSKMLGRRVYIETSSKPLYEPTRQFYLQNGYKVEAVLKDYYDIGDDKVMFSKDFLAATI